MKVQRKQTDGTILAELFSPEATSFLRVKLKEHLLGLQQRLQVMHLGCLFVRYILPFCFLVIFPDGGGEECEDRVTT